MTYTALQIQKMLLLQTGRTEEASKIELPEIEKSVVYFGDSDEIITKTDENEQVETDELEDDTETCSSFGAVGLAGTNAQLLALHGQLSAAKNQYDELSNKEDRTDEEEAQMLELEQTIQELEEKISEIKDVLDENITSEQEVVWFN